MHCWQAYFTPSTSTIAPRERERDSQEPTLELERERERRAALEDKDAEAEAIRGARAPDSSMGTWLRAATRTRLLSLSLGPSHHRTFAMTASLNADDKTPWDPRKTPYPPARRSDTVEYFQSAKAGGKVAVADPYDWLHDPDSNETKQFVQQQGEFTQQYLDQYNHKDQFTRELKKNWNYPRCAFPSLGVLRSPFPPHG